MRGRAECCSSARPGRVVGHLGSALEGCLSKQNLQRPSQISGKHYPPALPAWRLRSGGGRKSYPKTHGAN